MTAATDTFVHVHGDGLEHGDHQHGEHQHGPDGLGHDHQDHHDHPHASGPVVVESAQHHGPSHDGSVVLDIGAGIGAVVLYVPDGLAGIEIDIVGMGPGTTSTHSLVRPRVLPGGTRYAAVYPGLPEGAYRIPETAGFPAADLQVVGGSVAEVTWA